MLKCPDCGSDKLLHVDHDAKRVVGPFVFTMQTPGEKCTVCGRVLLDGPALEVQELAIAVDLAARGARDGQSFRFMRKAIGMSAVDLAKMLAVSPETISRWENEKEGREAERTSVAVLGALVVERVVSEFPNSPMMREALIRAGSMWTRLEGIASTPDLPKRAIRSALEQVAREATAWRHDSKGWESYGKSVAEMVDKLRRENEELHAKVLKLEKQLEKRPN